ncbi:unnamed protein product, partial [Rotaria sp. Silwood1]
RWCDYRGRWRSELIQHMRCHHARDKPYHCSACPYASSWKWDDVRGDDDLDEFGDFVR